MNNLINYHRLCIFFNIIGIMCVFSYLKIEKTNQYIQNTFSAFIMINFIKICNQSLIIKYFLLNISNIYQKLLTIDTVSDFVKFIVCNYIIAKTSTCSTLSICVALMIIYINYIIIIWHTLYKCYNWIRSRDEIEIDVIHNIEHNQQLEIYVPIEVNYDTLDYKVVTENNIICSICLEEQVINENWTKLHCTHDFHKKCIKNWLEINNICPVCRCSINNINNINNVNNT